MDKRVAAIGMVVLLVVLSGAVITTGLLGPFEGESGVSDPDTTDGPTDTGTVYEGNDGGSTGGEDADSPPFSFDVIDITECGQTCRDVTVTLSNTQTETATGVIVYTRIFAGNSTDDDDMVWDGIEEVGTLKANDAVTRTTRVKLGLRDSYRIKRNNGWVTVLTTVESDDITITFKTHEKVA